MPQRPIILFDVMDTLVVEPFYTAVPQFFGMTLDELLRAKHRTSWIEFELGQISEDEFIERFFSDGREIDGKGLRRCMKANYEWVSGMQAVVTELHNKGFEIHALSNYPIWYQMIEEMLGLSRYLQWTFVSCNTGYRKPDKRAFRYVCEELELAPNECLFIDDREVNVDAARLFGMRAILMRDADDLRRQLGRELER